MKTYTVYATKNFDVTISEIASDKSISHRSAMFAMLAAGTTRIRNFLRAEDTLNTLHIVQQLGATVEDKGEEILVTSNGIQEPSEILDCGNSGTGMRLFCGLLASAEGSFILTGDIYLKRRPMKRVTAPLRSIGAAIDGRNGGDLAPLHIRGGSLKAFEYDSPIASAQVKSAMILAALKADGICRYSEPELTRDHTERMLKGMGASVVTQGLTTYITPMKALLNPLDIRVPSDPSSAFFFAVAAAITPNSRVVLEGLTLNPTRIEAYKVLERMGAKISYIERENAYEPIGDIIVEHAPLLGVTVRENISWLIDELPALAIAMSVASGKSRVENAHELRVKESDRITTVMTNLNRCGITTHEFEDGYEITGGTLHQATVESFGDHRIAMSFAVAGLVCGMTIEDVACVDTSFPNFFTLLERLV
ncbi:MAG: 3-phosphoshikimate 1-carboxyvinyltransferase [Sulfuricurvum sp. PC08-66]|nr:MAG: 3-phosphoshikimate 1-carboxyvinyltransferase [Sulfuricurvum sp. PC08-66]